MDLRLTQQEQAKAMTYSSPLRERCKRTRDCDIVVATEKAGIDLLAAHHWLDPARV
jgi:hypothetical protein